MELGLFVFGSRAAPALFKLSTVNYQLSTPELVGSLIVYDDKGRVIKTLMNAELLGNAGSIQWDGTRDDYSKASIGIYIIAFEALNTSNGSLFQVKKAVTVAGKI